MKKLEVLQSVEGSVSSIFSREDVIKIINMIDENSGRKITTGDIMRAIDQTVMWIENNSKDVVDLQSAEFELSYHNQLEVVGIDINVDEVREALENNFMDFGEAEEEDDLVELERQEPSGAISI